MKREIDALLRVQIIAEVKNAMSEVLESSQEEWLTGDELGRRIQFFTKSWLKTYGQLLPRERVTVDDVEGTHRTGWCYPLHRIQRMIADGKLRKLVFIQGKGSTKAYKDAMPTIVELHRRATIGSLGGAGTESKEV